MSKRIYNSDVYVVDSDYTYNYGYNRNILAIYIINTIQRKDKKNKKLK